MKRNTKLALVLVSATALSAAVTGPVFAHGGAGQDGWGSQQTHQGGARGGNNAGHGGMGGGGMGGGQNMMMEMMRMHGQMGGGAGGMGGMGSGMGSGMGNGMGNGMGGNASLFGNLDTNGDGQITSQEAKAAQLAALKKYDANGDGTLSLAEFEALHSAATRERMVDRFQSFDNDGDGKVTADEISAQANRMEKLSAMRNGPDADHDEETKAPAGTQGGMMNDGGANAAPKN